MKSRDRQASGSAPQAALAVPFNEAGTAPSYQVGAPGAFLWEDWYRSATPDQRAELLDLARRQGLLYAHQIPPHANGCHHANGEASAPADPQVLKDLLAGQMGKLTPVLPPAVEVVDRDLDPLQRQAVARALATPDICLIQGPPGTGKSRVVQEILVQASQRGLRVLFLAQNAACVDGVLEKLADQEGVLPIRLAASGEEVPAAVGPMLLGQRVSNFRSQILEKANLSRNQSEDQCRERQSQADSWPAFAALVEQRQETETRFRTLANQLAEVAAEAESHAEGILGERLTELCNKKDADLGSVRKSLAQESAQETQKSQLEADLARQLQALVDRSQCGWWTLTRWKSLFSGESKTAQAEVDAQLQATRASLALIKERRQTLEQQCQQIEQTFQTERSRLLQEEIARRQRSLSEQDAELRAKLVEIEAQWQQLASRLEPEKLRPAAMTVAAIDEARRLWQAQRQLDEENCLLARQWVAYLTESGDRLAAQLPGLAGIVAGSLAAWGHEGASIPGNFDLLIVEEADKISEAALLPLARKAHRWILIGNYLGQPVVSTAAPANPREVRPAAARAGVFQKLWQLLHSDPSQLPYTWGEENGRLVCQLRPLSSQDLGRLERESLADAADIELRILTVPRSEPVLAQVVFPPGTTVARAKEFIFRELQETPVQTCGRNGWVEEHTDSFFWRLLPEHQAEAHQPEAPATASKAHGSEPDAQARDFHKQSVSLGAGLLEWLHQEQTVCLEFAKNHWNRTQVSDWLSGHFRHNDLGRTAFLQVPHRMEAGLSAWVGDVLFPSTLLFGKSTSRASVSFVSVHAPMESAVRGKKPPRESPSLEIDLAAGRGSERVPPELLAGLVRHGFANYLEAQAVIRTLENLHSTSSGSFGVIAFYAGQVELIRRLLARSTTLSGRTIQVGLPGHFLHGQCHVAVVSLTRSNSLRTGVFAAETTDPIVAMTRAREQLILVGDPETLLRWSQCPEHAESAEAGREKHWLRRLARYLRSEGHHQTAFQMCACPMATADCKQSGGAGVPSRSGA